MLNGKATIILLKTGLIYLRENMKVELDLSNYATKADLKEATNVDTSDFAKKMI